MRSTLGEVFQGTVKPEFLSKINKAEKILMKSIDMYHIHYPKVHWFHSGILLGFFFFFLQTSYLHEVKTNTNTLPPLNTSCFCPPIFFFLTCQLPRDKRLCLQGKKSGWEFPPLTMYFAYFRETSAPRSLPSCPVSHTQ